MTLLKRIFVTVLAFWTTGAWAQDSLNIGYFAEWPLPAHYGKATGAYDDALGAPAIWHRYDSSFGMYAALANGDIQIALAQGIVPFLQMAEAGPDFQIVDIAVSYPAAEGCVVSATQGFTTDAPTTLQNKTVALPMGTTVHFALLKQLAQLHINPLSLTFIDLPPAQAAAEFSQGNVGMACAWGPSLGQMLRQGRILMPASRKADIGVYLFDGTIIRASFGADNPEIVARFLKVTNDLNASFTANPAVMIPKIADATNMTQAAVRATMAQFQFPTITEKSGGQWLDGTVQNYLAQLGAFFVEQGTLDSTLTDFATSIDNSYLITATNLPLIAAE